MKKANLGLYLCLLFTSPAKIQAGNDYISKVTETSRNNSFEGIDKFLAAPLSFWGPRPECTDGRYPGHVLPKIATSEYHAIKEEFLEILDVLTENNIEYCSMFYHGNIRQINDSVNIAAYTTSYMDFEYTKFADNSRPIQKIPFQLFAQLNYYKLEYTLESDFLYYCADILNHTYMENKTSFESEKVECNNTVDLRDEAKSDYAYGFISTIYNVYDWLVNITYKNDLVEDRREKIINNAFHKVAKYKEARGKLEGFVKTLEPIIAEQIQKKLMYASNLIDGAIHECNQMSSRNNKTCSFKLAFQFYFESKSNMQGDVAIYSIDSAPNLRSFLIRIPTSLLFSASNELFTFALAHELSHAIYNYDHLHSLRQSAKGFFQNSWEAETDYLAMYLLKNSGYSIEKYSNVWKEFFSSIDQLKETAQYPSFPTRHILIQKTIDEIRYKTEFDDVLGVSRKVAPNTLPKCKPRA